MPLKAATVKKPDNNNNNNNNNNKKFQGMKSKKKSGPRKAQVVLDELKTQIQQLQTTYDAALQTGDVEGAAQQMTESLSKNALKLCDQMIYQCEDQREADDKRKMEYTDRQKQAALMLPRALDDEDRTVIEKALEHFHATFGIDTASFLDRQHKAREEREGREVYWPEPVDGELEDLSPF